MFPYHGTPTGDLSEATGQSPLIVRALAERVCTQNSPQELSREQSATKAVNATVALKSVVMRFTISDRVDNVVLSIIVAAKWMAIMCNVLNSKINIPDFSLNFVLVIKFLF